MTTYLKSLLFTFFLCPFILSGQNLSEYSSNTFLIQFDVDTNPLDIIALQNQLGAVELGMTPVNGIRMWQVSHFPIEVNDATGQIYTLNNIVQVQGFSDSKPKVNGTDLDYKLQDSENWNMFNFDYSNYYYTPTPTCSNYSLICPANIGQVKVGYIDTGLSTQGHDPMFSAYYQQDFNAIEPGSEPTDNHGHGTQLAGMAAATLADQGVSNAVQLVPLKAMDNTGSANLFHIIYAVEMAKIMGVNILNLSFGYHPMEGDASELLEIALRDATEAGMLVIASAGNDGMNIKTNKFYPACFSNRMNRMITVGSIGCNGSKSSFSNWSKNTVQIGVPGENILVPLVGGGWGKVNGTSYSAGITTTIAALIASHLYNFNADVIEFVMLESAYPTNYLSNKFSTGGFIDAEYALDLLYYYYGLTEDESKLLMPISERIASLSSTMKANEINIETQEAALSLTAFPNPFVDNLHLTIKGVQQEKATIQIFNAAGQLIKTIEKNLSTTNIQTIELELSELEASGLYHVQLATGTTVLNTKIYKK